MRSKNSRALLAPLLVSLILGVACGGGVPATAPGLVTEAAPPTVTLEAQATRTVEPQTVTAVYLRLNTVGYKPQALKIAVAASAEPLEGTFSVVLAADGAPIFEGTLGEDQGAWGAFAHHYLLDFSQVQTPGTYRVQLANGAASPDFEVSDEAYAGLADLSRQFFAVQRSGNTQPDGHGPSHLNDAPLASDPTLVRDVTGGWYDAGDYLKFTLTVSYATLFQLLAYRDAPAAFSATDANGTPQILAEANIGLDWLEKMWDADEPMLYAQVGSAADHNQGQRLPEDDTLDGTPDRPLYASEPGQGANLAGKTAAAFALAAQVNGEADPERAAHYQALAEAIFAWGQARPASQPSLPGDYYNEDSWQDDMALAAAELFRLTGDEAYQTAAQEYATAAGAAYWFSWDAVNGLAQAELGRADPGYQATAAEFLLADLTEAQKGANLNPWALVGGEHLVWGSLFPVLGAALEARWYQELTGDTAFAPLAQAQLDFALGRNPWGLSLLVGAGASWAHDPHHQVAALGLRPAGRELLGAWMAGPATAEIIAGQGFQLAEADEFAAFQSPEAVYQDDRNNYVTNEPTIALNAAGLLLMAYAAAP